MRLLLLGISLGVLAACSGVIQDGPSFMAELNARARKGKVLYSSQNCTRCHGADGRSKTHHAMFTSNNPTNLRKASEYRHGSDSASIVQTLRTGVASTSMPPYPHLSEEDLLCLSEYLRAWQRETEKTTSTP